LAAVLFTVMRCDFTIIMRTIIPVFPKNARFRETENDALRKKVFLGYIFSARTLHWCMIYNELQENQKSAAAGALHLFFENFRFRETKFSEKHGFFGRFFGQKSGRWRPEKPFNDGGMTKSGGKWRKFFKEKKPPEIQPRFLRKNAPKPQ
jgi:hypothetical protein